MSKVVIGFLVGAGLLIAARFGIARYPQVTKEQSEYQAELKGATPIRDGSVTAKELVRRTLYNGIRQGENDKPINELIAPLKGQKLVYGLTLMVRRVQEFTGTETPKNYFHLLAGESDLVIRGKALNQDSQITADGMFLFSDYRVGVTEVFKNNSAVPIEVGDTINVALPGGKVLIDAVIVKASGNSTAILPVNDAEVVLFLKYIPETGDYKLARYNGSFELNSHSVRALAGRFPADFLKDEAAFLKTLRTASERLGNR